MLPIASLVFLAIFCEGSDQKEEKSNLPSYINQCDMNEPHDVFTKCVKDQITVTLPHFTKGIPELNVPSIDPVQLEDIIIDGNGLKLYLRDAAMHGLGQAKITDLKINIGHKGEDFVMTFKSNMNVTGKYEIDGRILILPIQGKGDAQIQTQDVEVEISSKLLHVKDDKGDHFKLGSPNYKYKINKTTFIFENLFNGNKQLSDATHQFANENWQQIMDDLAPPVIKQIVRTCVKAINKFFAKITITEMMKNYKSEP